MSQTKPITKAAASYAAADKTDQAPITSATYTLKTPVTFDGQTVTELTFKPLLWGDLEDAEAHKSQMAMNRHLLASMSGLDPEFFKKVPARELVALLKAAAPLMGNEEDMAELFDRGTASS